MFRKVLLAAALIAAVLPTMAAEAAPASAPIQVPMSDGITLAGDVHLPGEGKRFPTILIMSPYGRDTTTTYLAEGYAHVNVDIRGSGGSGGTLCLFCDREQQDAAEVVEWIAQQPWSNGRVGMWGGSYRAITALLAAAKQPRHLHAVVARHPYTDMYRDIVWHNGIYNQQFVAAWTALQGSVGLKGAHTSDSAADRSHNTVALQTRQHALDGPLYWERSVYTKFDKIKTPVLITDGWFDGFSRAAVRNFQGIASPHKRLIMSAETHNGTGGPSDPLNPHGSPTSTGSTYGTAGPPPGPEDQVLAWFDRFLKGEQNGVEKLPAMQYLDMGTGAWQGTSVWPPRDARVKPLRLSGPVTPGAAGGLTAAVPSGVAARPESYVYDPTVGVTETFSKWAAVAAVPHIRLDQRADQIRSLTYATPPLAAPLKLAGPMELRLWAATDAPDTDWIVKVADVDPSGSASIISSGYLRASHREVDPKRSLAAEPWISNVRRLDVPTHSAVEYRLDIWPIAAELPPGHRLAIAVSSSDVPNHEPLPHPARNVLLHDRLHPSTLYVTTRD